ncbi:MAG: thioesterase family protein [candidate division NC10 bacterium]|nr:thioesterase family protein [candidate division NC10 bacterium]MBI2115667.1 thioesterase family protein [candidate division NC10 bacterium]MBI2455283.1 thioesterase family protein [candidate division NC10 bacterium]MBI3087022.1 thioesterase family protein [candidate division NC10 bacterium]
MPIEPGVVGEVQHRVTPETFASQWANPGIEVLATPVVVGWLEGAAIRAVQPFLEPGQGSVGTMVSMKHLAATPAGMTVRATATVTEVDGRRIRFSVEAHDEKEKIAEGEHERFIVNMAKFLDRVAQKAKS